MRAFDPLFRGRRRMRREMSDMGGNIGILGLIGLGYAAYRFLKTERGRAVKDSVVDQMRHLGERMRMPSQRPSTQSRPLPSSMSPTQF